MLKHGIFLLFLISPNVLFAYDCSRFKFDVDVNVNLENKADSKFYPSCLAMELSKKYSLILDKQDIETICCDFIKTELSKKYKNVLNVFENDGISNIFTDVDDTTQQEILKTLSSIFSKETVTVNKNFIVDEIFNLFKKNKFINFLTSGSTGISKQCNLSTNFYSAPAYPGFCLSRVFFIISSAGIGMSILLTSKSNSRFDQG